MVRNTKYLYCLFKNWNGTSDQAQDAMKTMRQSPAKNRIRFSATAAPSPATAMIDNEANADSYGCVLSRMYPRNNGENADAPSRAA